MRSKIALIGLALVDLSAGGPCKPSGRTTVSSLPSSVATIDVSESSTDSQTDFDSLTTQVPSLTLPEPSTTTQEEVIIITNAILGGSFASRDPNSPSGLTNFDASGNAKFHSGGCYKADGSKDDGCAALTASGNSDTKRSFFSSFASIFQTVRQGCVASSIFGDTEFYSQPDSNSGASWIRVLEQVEAVSDLPTFAISLTCSGAGTSSILVDSVFISDQVTPQTIDDFKLDLGGSSPIEIGSATAVRAEESSSFTTGPSRPTGTDGLENTSTVEPTPTVSAEVTFSAVTGTKPNRSHESSEIETNLPVDRTSEGITDTTAIKTSPTLRLSRHLRHT
ncbi:hypothetical protein NW762_013218 [Fusarium torreyae]|uniref:Uncharacterized protein n=1 Tax=Fusarium torreyae TaxID=1237075 RepID=A0A9W8RPY9_9HYPO|nr:hypothetical protein NW762_013218 [Fusarium torreyae]